MRKEQGKREERGGKGEELVQLDDRKKGRCNNGLRLMVPC